MTFARIRHSSCKCALAYSVRLWRHRQSPSVAVLADEERKAAGERQRPRADRQSISASHDSRSGCCVACCLFPTPSLCFSSPGAMQLSLCVVAYSLLSGVTAGAECTLMPMCINYLLCLATACSFNVCDVKWCIQTHCLSAVLSETIGYIYVLPTLNWFPTRQQASPFVSAAIKYWVDMC